MALGLLNSSLVEVTAVSVAYVPSGRILLEATVVAGSVLSFSASLLSSLENFKSPRESFITSQECLIP